MVVSVVGSVASRFPLLAAGKLPSCAASESDSLPTIACSSSSGKSGAVIVLEVVRLGTSSMVFSATRVPVRLPSTVPWASGADTAKLLQNKANHVMKVIMRSALCRDMFRIGRCRSDRTEEVIHVQLDLMLIKLILLGEILVAMGAGCVPVGIFFYILGNVFAMLFVVYSLLECIRCRYAGQSRKNTKTFPSPFQP